MNKFFDGLEVYGDKFSQEEIAKWYEEEREGYSSLGNDKEISNYKYAYHKQNIYNGYSKLPPERIFAKSLSIGGAYGHEILPIIKRIEEIHILEPSLKLRSLQLEDKFPIYHTPSIDGTLLFEDYTFDLITCFGTLHHIPNVSFVLSEIKRVCKPNGYILIREPIVSMGDWAKPRGKLTKNERGLPLKYIKEFLKTSPQFEIVNINYFGAKPIDRLFKILFQKSIMASDFGMKVDSFFSKLFYFNYRYHATSWLEKIRPTAIYFVLKRNY